MERWQLVVLVARAGSRWWKWKPRLQQAKGVVPNASVRREVEHRWFTTKIALAETVEREVADGERSGSGLAVEQPSREVPAGLKGPR
jgi:hypothetical protein